MENSSYDLFYVSTGTIRSRNKESNSKNLPTQENIFFKTFYPILILYRIFGIGPFVFADQGSGNVVVKKNSLLFIYSVIMSTFWVLMSLGTICRIIHQILDISFSKAIEYYIIMSVLSEGVILPIIVWIESRKSIKYVQQWYDFQILYHRLLCAELRLPSSLIFFIKVNVFLFVVFGAFLLVTEILTVNLELAFPVSTAALMYMGHVNSMFLHSRIVRIVSENYKAHIRMDLSTKKISEEMIENYRLVWVNLSQLVQDSGAAFPLVVTWHVFLTMLYLLFTFYHFVSTFPVYIFEQDYLNALVSISTPFVSLALIFMLCDVGYKQHVHVTSDMLQLVSQIRNSISNSTVIFQECSGTIKLFLRGLTEYPPVVWINGYFLVDRPLFGSFVSVIITYLIVLIQFRNIN